MSPRDPLATKLLALVGASQAISAAPSVPDLCERVLDAAARILELDSVAVLLLSPDRSELHLTAFRGNYPGVSLDLKLDIAGKGITTWVARTGEAQRVGDVARDDRHVSGGLEQGSELAVPMKAAGEIVGVVDVQSSALSAFGEDEALLVETLAGHAAVAVLHLRAVEELEGKRSRLETILACSADAIITTDDRGRITYFSPGAEELFGWNATDVVGTRVADYYLGGEREARRVQRHVQEEGKVRNYEAWFRTARGEQVPTSLSASVLADRDGRILGTLGILKDVTVEKRLERKLSYTIEMLQEANENLGRLALTDSLSGLKNQRFFHRKLEEELLRSQRTLRPTTLLLIDIDKFKKFNDSFGHQVGDRVIQEMGTTILQSIRKIDHGCRYGGEEFTVILPETSADNAQTVGRRVATAFAGSPAWQELGLEPPTLSMGLACHDGSTSDAIDAETLVKRADDAMYRVKRRGGNGLEVA
jgi:diguanylate cyclase (GGDEF)-like protein/PAS domain S-box-containing protein